MSRIEESRNDQWDFRTSEEIRISREFEEKGYVIEKGRIKNLDIMRGNIEGYLNKYLRNQNSELEKSYELGEAHKVVSAADSNKLRLSIMQNCYKSSSFAQNYYLAAQEVIGMLCGNELAMQKRFGLSVNMPTNEADALPIHADTWNGVSPFELNIWIPLVDCKKTMSLYILKKDRYEIRINEDKGLLKLDSDELFRVLENDIEYIEIEYGNILAFDQSLPHGYSTNQESSTHWSLNCRFKGLHTPYWDKKLGEYFMPINVKTCTRIGVSYREPENWL